jgi:hypothetical protein
MCLHCTYLGYIPERRENMFNVNIKHVNGFLEDDTAAVGLFQRGRKTVPGSGKSVVVFSSERP